MRTKMYFAILVLLASLFVTASAQTSHFTYQGRLADSSLPASGTYEMQFSVWDAPTMGSQQGTTITNTAVTVTGGTFTVQLDFTGTPFATGANRWLEIAVKKNAEPYATLTPRQQITSNPFSIRSAAAGSADSMSAVCNSCITDAQIIAIGGSKVTGTVANAAFASVAGNVSGVVATVNGGTGSPTQNFVDLSTNQNVGGTKTFTGSLAGNGSGLTNVPGTFKWNVVAGTSQQMAGHNGYLANNAAQVTVTLPASPVVGDTIRVVGAGAGGWKIAQNAGQLILTPTLPTNNANGTKSWRAVASSIDGLRLVAVVNGGQIFTSTDSGVTWTARESFRNWQSVASSSDGTRLVAVVNGDLIYTSTDTGVTWTPRESIRNWYSVASSSDGTKLVAGAQGGRIYTSTDSGVTWTPRESIRNWYSVASSSDGIRLVAGAYNGLIYTSTDSGVTWTPRESIRLWWSVDSSSDGLKLVAVVLTGQIYTSTDSGVTWTPRDSNRSWLSIASSFDGTRLVAVVVGGQIYTSTDSGVTWTPRDSNRNWYSVASSSDGIRLAAVANAGTIYTSTDSGVTWTPLPPHQGTTVGTTGNITGQQSANIELIYIGSGQFLTIASAGNLVVN